MCQQSKAGCVQQQQENLSELRNALGEQLLNETPIFNDDFSLLRWLAGWNNDIDKIVPRFKRASKMFRLLGVNELQPIDCDVDAFNEFCRTITPISCMMKTNSPGGLLGIDPEGNLVNFIGIGQSRPKDLMLGTVRVSDIYRHNIVETALAYQMLKAQERKRKQKLGVRLVVDLEGFGREHLSMMTHQINAHLMTTMQELFSDLGKDIYIINAHPLFNIVYNLLKRAIPEQTRQKMVFLDSSDYRERLFADIGAHNMFQRWGGIRSQNGFAFVEQAEQVPPAMPTRMEEAQMTKLNVPARQKRVVEVEVAAEGVHTLQWHFVANGVVAFGVLEAEDRELFPVMHLCTADPFAPEFGTLKVEGGNRRYKLLFDNSFGTFFGKEIKYFVKVLKEEDGGE